MDVNQGVSLNRTMKRWTKAFGVEPPGGGGALCSLRWTQTLRCAVTCKPAADGSLWKTSCLFLSYCRFKSVELWHHRLPTNQLSSNSSITRSLSRSVWLSAVIWLAHGLWHHVGVPSCPGGWWHHNLLWCVSGGASCLSVWWTLFIPGSINLSFSLLLSLLFFFVCLQCSSASVRPLLAASHECIFRPNLRVYKGNIESI